MVVTTSEIQQIEQIITASKQCGTNQVCIYNTDMYTHTAILKHM